MFTLPGRKTGGDGWGLSKSFGEAIDPEGEKPDIKEDHL